MLLPSDLYTAALPATSVTARPAPHRGPHRRELREGGAGRDPRQAVQDHGPIAAARPLPGEAGARALGEAGGAQAADQEAVEGRRGNAPRLHPPRPRPGAGRGGGPGAASPAAGGAQRGRMAARRGGGGSPGGGPGGAARARVVGISEVWFESCPRRSGRRPEFRTGQARWRSGGCIQDHRPRDGYLWRGVLVSLSLEGCWGGRLPAREAGVRTSFEAGFEPPGAFPGAALVVRMRTFRRELSARVGSHEFAYLFGHAPQAARTCRQMGIPPQGMSGAPRVLRGGAFAGHLRVA